MPTCKLSLSVKYIVCWIQYYMSFHTLNKWLNTKGSLNLQNLLHMQELSKQQVTTRGKNFGKSLTEHVHRILSVVGTLTRWKEAQLTLHSFKYLTVFDGLLWVTTTTHFSLLLRYSQYFDWSGILSAMIVEVNNACALVSVL